MRALGQLLWILPFAAHVAYVLATVEQLPASLGGDGEAGTATSVFVVEWFAILGAANLAFAVLHLRLPRLPDRMLQVPGKEHWLATPEHRAELVERLRGVCEVALTMLNVLFLAVYQSIYQTNAALPILALPPSVLFPAFMVAPLLITVGHLLRSLRALATDARGAAARELPIQQPKR